MQIHLFGATTPSGEAFRELAGKLQEKWTLYSYSRCTSNHNCTTAKTTFRADLLSPHDFAMAGDPCAPSLWVSFGPIWLLGPFLQQLAAVHPERLRGMCGLVACSSSSAITKRYAANPCDSQLANLLTVAEDQLLATCRKLDVHCFILRPTLIYGQVGPYGDRNLSRLLRLMRQLPLLPLPANTGMRQPIHAVQLAAVACFVANRISATGCDPGLSSRIAVGGDEQLSYRAMLEAMQRVLSKGDPARRCRFLPIPNRLFFLMAAPLMLWSPKAYEALLRIASNLSDFTPSHELLGKLPQRFPVLPLV
jgi:hypothetical protein